MSAFKIGDRVRKRGTQFLGNVIKLGVHPGWVHVSWDDGYDAFLRPAYCSDIELNRVEKVKKAIAPL